MRLVGLTFGCLFLMAATAHAKTFKVEPGGPQDTPITDAIQLLDGRDKLIIMPGEYTDILDLRNLDRIKVIGKGDVVLKPIDNRAPIHIRDSTNISIKGITVDTPQSDAVEVVTSTKVVLKDVHAIDPGRSGFHLQNSDDVTMKKCSSKNGTFAIEVFDVDRCRIIGCTAENAGISFGQGDPAHNANAQVRKNTVMGTQFGGIGLSGPNGKCERNKTFNCNPGIQVITNSSSDGTVISRNVCEGGTAGVTVTAAGVTVARNVTRNTTSAGISATQLAPGLVIDNNRVENNMGFAAISTRASGSRVTRNKCIDPLDRGINANTDDGHYEKNVVTNAGTFGFVVQKGGNTLIRNTATGSGTADLRSFVDEDQNTYNKNKFETESF